MQQSSSIVIPLSAADVTTANVQDNQVYQVLTSCLPLEIIKKTHYMVADPGYDDQYLYEFSKNNKFYGFLMVFLIISQSSLFYLHIRNLFDCSLSVSHASPLY
jgi:hypothetical protein